MERMPSRTRCQDCQSRVVGTFCELDDRNLAILDRGKSHHSYKRGQILFHEGTPALGVYCLRSGRVKASCASGGGKTHILRIHVPGALLGLEDLFAGKQHSTTAEMLEEGTACFVDRSLVYEIFSRQPRAAQAIAAELARLAQRSERERTELTLGGVREKVARVILDLARHHGNSLQQGVRISVDLTREEIAAMAGTAVETTIRQISAFREEGILASGHDLIVLDAARLAQAARDQGKAEA